MKRGITSQDELDFHFGKSMVNSAWKIPKEENINKVYYLLRKYCFIVFNRP